MAKESMKAREVKRAKLVEKYAAKRAKLKEEGDYIGLSLLPKNSSRVRLHNRCKLTGRPRGYMRQFGISRIQEKGYILNYKFEQDGVRSNIKIALKYHPETKAPAIRTLTRVSKPGLRRYTNVEDMPRVLNGLGIAILSTSLGVMSDKEARQKNVGGEVLCYVY